MKVTIIGASTAGLFLAYLLAREGVEVEVYDKAAELGSPPRTLIVTSQISDVLGFIPEEAILNRVKHIELYSRSRTARLEFDSPDLVIERKELVKLLAGLAEAAGAKILLRHQFVGFGRDDGKIGVTLKNLDTGESPRTSADILVGADGGSSAVCRLSARNGHACTSLIQTRVRPGNGSSGNTIKVWFDSNLTRYFFWKIPESAQAAAVGLITDRSEQAETALSQFLREKQLEPLEVQAAAVPMHRLEFPCDGPALGKNVFFVGDAGAQVKVTTVGGVVTGLKGAQALTRAILNGRDYRKELRTLNQELNLHLLLRKLLNTFTERDYDELLGFLRGELKTVLQTWNRDELTKAFFRMIFKEPRLLKVGARAVLRSLFEAF